MTQPPACTVLIVDDDATNSQHFEQALKNAGMCVFVASDAESAVTLIREKTLDVVLIAVGSESFCGFELLSSLTSVDGHIKVIMMVAHFDPSTLKRALRENAYDVVEKTFSEQAPVIACVHRAAESSHLLRENEALIERLQASHDKVTAANKRLMQLNKQLRKLAITDGLTQLYNRRYIDDWIQNYAFSNTATDARYSIILLDIDHFKNINDSIGHDGGDKVLKHLAKILSDSSRDEDLVGRYGGEEFIVVMPGTDEEESVTAAERIRKLIESAVITISSGTIKATASLGISTNLTTAPALTNFPLTTAEAFFSGRALVAQADKALYFAKDNGRNQSVHFNRLPEEPALQTSRELQSGQ